MTNVIQDATARLLAAVDALPDAEWAAPSVCVGWTRAHVIAHLALNAEGLAAVLRGLGAGQATTMYASNEQRDADIDTLAAAPPAEIRTRLRAAAARFDAALAGPAAPAETRFERTPGGQQMRAGVVPKLRLWEVEIHHADLNAGYSHADWPRETALAFIQRAAGQPVRPDCHVLATDGDEEWTFGSAGSDAPIVRGPVTALAWWASGRATDEIQQPGT